MKRHHTLDTKFTREVIFLESSPYAQDLLADTNFIVGGSNIL